MKVLHENGNHGRAVDSRYMTHHLASLSPKQHSMIQVVRTPHIGTMRKLLTKAGSLNILVHMVAVCDAFQAVLGFLCCQVLGCFLDRVDAFVAYNEMTRGYTENLLIRRTLVIKRIFSAVTIYRCMRLTRMFYNMSTSIYPMTHDTGERCRVCSAADDS